MAFTPTEEAQLRAVITAFESGKTISEIAASTEVFTTDVLEIVQSAVSKKATIAQIITLVNSELGISTISYKLSGIESGSQVNVIESVKVNNTVLPISSKSVNITVPTQPSEIGAEPALGFTPEQAGVAQSLIAALKNGVSTEGDTLKKLYDLIVASFSEVQVATIAERDAYDVTKLPTNVFVLDDGDLKWALYKATTTGINATYVKLSDPDLLNAVMTASQIATSYESVDDVNRFTDALKAKLDAFTANFTAELKATYDGKISPKQPETATPYTIGQQVEGGVVFYILQPTDIGYESGKQKFLIAATVDQNSGIQWYANSYVTTNATNIEIGRGLANTDLIVSAQGTSVQYAARLCSDYAGGGYTDWYLGSLDEMMKLSDNKVAAGINDLAGAYWTSSEVSNQYALVVYTVPMSEYNSIQKNQSYAVRAIRTSVLVLGYSLPVDGEIILASGTDGKEVKGGGISLANLLNRLECAFMVENVITSTDGIYSTELEVVTGTNIFSLPIDFDFSRQSIFFDGGAMVKPTISQLNNTATFALVPMEANDIRILYYKKTL